MNTPWLRFVPGAGTVLLVTWASGSVLWAQAVRRFDFQPAGAPLERGHTEVTPDVLYSPRSGYGFTRAPAEAVNGSRHAWPIFGRRVRVDDGVPSAVLSNATRDAVVSRRPGQSFAFRVDVPSGTYDVTLWLGDVTRPLFQVRATVNGEVIDVERMDVLITRGRLDVTTLPDGRTPSIGNAVPRTVRVDAFDGTVEVTVGPGESTEPATWDFVLDECPSVPRPERRQEVIVPAYSGAGLQALTLHPAVDPPLVAGAEPGTITLGDAPDSPPLLGAVELYNSGDVTGAREAFAGLFLPELRVARAAGLFWVAGHPATLGGERALLAEAEALLEAALVESPDDYAASDLLLSVRLADDAERYRELLGYGGTPAVENLGRANALVEQFQPDHPYYLKGQILWLRNRGGLDPRRCTVSWERAQWLAQQLDPAWGNVNPYVHLYATDEWLNDGRPWTFVDWGDLAGEGPEWARVMVSTLNAWLDLFEWWSIHRQTDAGEIGGGWTDDVEIIPAFAITSFVLEDASHISQHASLKFADGIWSSDIIDRERGYQAQYADVEHTAEPTGYSLPIYPLLRPGDPEGLERILRSAKTFADFFLTTTPAGHTHFKGNHMSATEIARDPNHRGDIPLNGRAVAPLSFLLWFSSNPGIEAPLRAWTEAWVADAARTEKGKPAGVFPQFVWVPTDELGYPGTSDWYSRNTTHGQWSAFPGYQYHLYSMAAIFHLRTGDPAFRAPFDALQTYALEWDAAGRPDYGGDAAPPAGEEEAWAGAKLVGVAGGALFALDRAVGGEDWDPFLERFARSYAEFAQDPRPATLMADNMDELAAELRQSWPYRTTEGVMTDRILLPGWYNVISYYLGTDVLTFFLGLPQHAVTWAGTGRLFAAAVTESSTRSLGATTYLFADRSRTVRLKLWNLEVGGSYVLEAGPAEGLAGEPVPVEQRETFTLEHRGDVVSFDLPGRAVYSLRIRQTAPGSPTTPLVADLAAAPGDIVYDARRGGLVVTVHNVGARDATEFSVRLHDGRDAEGTVIGTESLPGLEAPLDLVPRQRQVLVPFVPPSLPREITVVLDPENRIPEISEVNNTATAVIGAAVPSYPPPMLMAVDPTTAAAGGQVVLSGRNFRPGLVALASEDPTEMFSVEWIDEEQLVLRLEPTVPPATYLVSVRNLDHRQSNLLPLRVTEGLPAVRFRRGDANQSGDGNPVDLSDAVSILNFLFLGEEGPHCLKSADGNDDGEVNISDPIFLLVFLFLGGAEPPAPGPNQCGADPTPDELSCHAHPPCQ